jgi:MFS family permease
VFGRKTHDVHDDTVQERDTGPVYAETPHDRYGGFTFAAAFYGWLVAVALTVLLAGIVGAIATASGVTLNVTQSEAEREAGTIGLATAIALILVLLIAYFAGGYVAGRMSRFDGGRQGLGVWVLGLLVTIVVAVLGAIFGTQYDVFQRVNLPSVPVPTHTLTVGGVITLVAVVLGTLMAAMLGGKAGQRYHTKIDRAVT